MPAIDQSDYVTAHADDLPGWFQALDRHLFVALGASTPGGDLLEIGAYLGKSAILLGYLARPAERVIVIDLFEEPPAGEAAREHDRFYVGLTQAQFEQNYRRFHDRLPEILVGYSHDVLPSIPDRSCRLVHVDGSHAFDAVRRDIAEACRVATADSLIVLDDVLSPHTPGVTAAAWESVLDGRLVPLVQSEIKLYLTPPGSVLLDADLTSACGAQGLEVVDSSPVLGHPVLEVRRRPDETRWQDRAVRLLPPVLADAVLAGRRRGRARR